MTAEGRGRGQKSYLYLYLLGFHSWRNEVKPCHLASIDEGSYG